MRSSQDTGGAVPHWFIFRFKWMEVSRTLQEKYASCVSPNIKKQLILMY